MPERGKTKGSMEIEMFFFLFGIIFAVMILLMWQTMGMATATSRMSELKTNTVTQIKDILLMMQKAPVESFTCASLRNCNRVNIHNSYIEIWGPTNDYFKEGEYLSGSLVGNMELYYLNDRSGEWESLPENGFGVACGSEDEIVFVCFKKVGEEIIHIAGLETIGK